MSHATDHGRAVGPLGWVNRLVLDLLRTPARGLLGRGLCTLSYVGSRSGRPVELPVQAAVTGDRAVVLVGRADRKRWWRAFRTPWPVRVSRGDWVLACTGRVLTPDDEGYAEAARAYRNRFAIGVAPGDLQIVVTAG